MGAGEETQTGATLTGVALREGAELAAAAKSVAIWAGTALKNIVSSAYQAMAGVIAAWPSAGPWGWAIGLGLGAAAFAGVMNLTGNIKSAQGGFDVPHGVNPIAQLHQDEMVLPAEHANTIRSLKDGGSAASGDTHLHFVSAAVRNGYQPDNPGVRSKMG